MPAVDIRGMIWVFPILFIFHDLEEIFFLLPWIRKNRTEIAAQIPKLGRGLLTHLSTVSTAAFCLGVIEELFLIVLICIIAFEAKWYLLWAGAVIAFTIHLIVHLLQPLIIRKYIPVIITSILCLPICAVLIASVLKEYEPSIILVYSILMIALMAVNLWLIHKGMTVIDRYIKRRGVTSQ